MGDITDNETLQITGLTKITDGARVAEITASGELKVKDAGTTRIIGGEVITVNSDVEVARLLRDILAELRLMNIYNVKITDEVLTPRDLRN